LVYRRRFIKMRGILTIFIILFSLTTLVYAMGERPTKIEELPEDIEIMNLKVEGTYCPGCIPTIRNALQKVSGVKKVEVNLKGEAKVYAEKGKVDPVDLIKAVEKAGYKASLVNRRGKNGRQKI